MPHDYQADLAQLGAETLRYLIRHIQTGSSALWGWDRDNPDHAHRICRTAAQLIENTNWAGCQEDVFPLLTDICAYLQHHTATDPDQYATTASRLKSVLQYGAHAPRLVDREALANSIAYIGFVDAGELTADVFSLLCVTDLLGFHRKLVEKDNPLVSASPFTQEYNARVRDRHQELLGEIRKEWTRLQKSTPKDFSFAVTQFLLWDQYGKATPGEPLYEDLMALKQMTHAYDTKYQLIDRYVPHHFSEVVYPKLILAWVTRKKLLAFDLADTYRWFIPEMHRLLAERGDPFHLGLALKLCLAANKDGVRTQFREQNLAQLLDAQRAAEEQTMRVHRDRLDAIVRRSLRTTMKLDKLTGGWSSASVWRMSGTYALPIEREGGERPFTLVVKTGKREDFTQSARLYAALGESARQLFPAHASQPSAIETDEGPLYYLFMQELTPYVPLGTEILALLPRDPTQAFNTPRFRQLLLSGLQGLRQLHGTVPPSDSVLPTGLDSHMKLASMFQSLERIHARELLPAGLTLGIRVADGEAATDLPNASGLVADLLKSVGKIVRPAGARVQRISLSHGDCHAHNIMLHAKTLDRARFVDIGSLCRDDYLNDYADLVTHVCFSLPLERLADDTIVLRQRNDATARHLDITYDWTGHASVLGTAYAIIWDEVEALVRERGETNEAAASLRFLMLLGRRLLFVASVSREPHKSALLLVQGLGVLAALQRRLRTPGAVSIRLPCSRIII